MTNQDWVDWVENENSTVTMTAEEAEQMDDLCEEIIRLRERVKVLEVEQERPDGAFWGQLAFDVLVYIGIILLVIRG